MNAPTACTEPPWGWGTHRPQAQILLLSNHEVWQQRLQGFKRSGYWMPTHWGARPGEPGCRVPSQFMTEFEK